jgi:hypothetical protein
MTDGIINILNVKNPLFISLIIGYVGYWFCYHGFLYGKDERLFKILVFSLPSLIILESFGYSIDNFSFYYLWIIIVILIFTIVIAILWRIWGGRLLYNTLYKYKISNEDGYKTVFDSIMMNNNTIYYTQIFVGLKNGKVLGCINIEDYKDSAIKSFIIDKDENIAMYVDIITDKEGKEEKLDNVKNNDYGDLLTIIKKDEISYIYMRIKKNDDKKNDDTIRIKKSKIVNFIYLI